ncbi:activator 1 subunit 3 [Purpureocillium lavendulum]|uniref:Activator 1 subunit 3 n=1 Tax=Purpureocillium lavendulum TaxID=1247861 RepID=A0AB34FRP3_9HYPO|nr:activator 1 subunit 3 [Purpureocillium lavendulum]
MSATADEKSASSARQTDNGAPLISSASASIRTPDQTLTSADMDMLTVDFSTPLAGAARDAKLRQMAEKHPAYGDCQRIQQRLGGIRDVIINTPGVANDDCVALTQQLREIGMMVRQETAQLVDAVVTLSLDQEDTDKAIARISIAANLAGAKTDDQAHTINQLTAAVASEKEKLAAEKTKREQAEAGAKKTAVVLEELMTDVKALKETMSRAWQIGPSQADLVQALAPSIDGIERHLTANTPTRASEANRNESTGASLFSPAAARPVRTTSPIKEEDEDEAKAQVAAAFEHQIQDPLPRSAFADAPPRPASAFQPMARSPTVAPPRFGPLDGVPPRAPSAFAQERRFQPLYAGAPAHRASSGSGGATVANSAFGPLTTSRAPSNFQPLARYRPTAPEFHPSAGYAASQAGALVRPGTSFGHRSQFQATTPTSAGRSRFGRVPEGAPAGNTEPPAPSFAMVHHGLLSPAPIQLTPQAIAAWNERIMDFYGKIRTFVERHASEPEHGPVSRVANSSVWHTLLATYRPLSEPEAASYLEFHLRNENSKACVVTRLIIDYVVNRVWVPGAWAGSDSQTTYELMDLGHEFEATSGQPSAARQPLLNRQAAIIAQVLRNEQGTMWHQSRVAETTRSLQTALQPLTNRHANPAEAQRELAAVAECAWDLSAQILTSRLTFDFRFPEVSSRFSPQSMLPIWPVADPADLQAKHFRVALVTTPVITCRNDTGAGISAHLIALADVFCMQ